MMEVKESGAEDIRTTTPTWNEFMQSLVEMRLHNLEIQKMQEDTARQMAETDRRMAETDRRMAETDRKMAETDRKMKQLLDQFTTQWGRLIEELAKPAALKLFKEIGIDIDHVFQESRHRKKERQEMEVDVLLVNTTDVVVVEVKTTLKKDDVDHFLKQMEKFKDLFREYANRTAYVAVAALKFADSSDKYALSKGVFVLRANGEYVFQLDDVPQNRRLKF